MSYSNVDISNNFASIVFEHSPVALCLVDYSGRLSLLNQEFIELFGYSKEELIGKSVDILIPTYLKKNHQKHVQMYLNTPTKKLMGEGRDLLGVMKGGEVFPVEVGLNPLLYRKQKFILVSVIDISERKKNEEVIVKFNRELVAALELVESQRREVLKSQEQYKAILENLDDIYYRTDNDQKIVIVSPSALKYSSFVSTEEFIGKNVPETFYYNPKDRELLLNALEKNKGSVCNFEITLKDKDGHPIPFETNSHYIKNKDGKIVGVEGVLRDIASKKRLENILKESNKRLQAANKKVNDSISYAQLIQESLLTNNERFNNFFKNHFVIFKPKDIVSGDFYYLNKKGDYIFFTVGDCTGHGVPGAILSVMAITFLHSNLSVKKNAAQMLDGVRESIKSAFESIGNPSNEGFDCAFCIYNTKHNSLSFAGAFNPLVIMRGGEQIVIKPTRNPVGFYLNEVPFENHTIDIKSGDKVYLFSDGYQDQFGGGKNKKFTRKRLFAILKEINKLDFIKQKEVLLQQFDDWKGNDEQVDDVTILGIEFYNTSR